MGFDRIEAVLFIFTSVSCWLGQYAMGVNSERDDGYVFVNLPIPGYIRVRRI
jgi:hypothetical protein